MHGIDDHGSIIHTQTQRTRSSLQALTHAIKKKKKKKTWRDRKEMDACVPGMSRGMTHTRKDTQQALVEQCARGVCSSSLWWPSLTSRIQRWDGKRENKKTNTKIDVRLTRHFHITFPIFCSAVPTNYNIAR